jgi:hypothetical protein
MHRFVGSVTHMMQLYILCIIFTNIDISYLKVPEDNLLHFTLLNIQGLAIKFPDWCEKRNKKKSKIILFLFKVICTYLNTFVESF